MQPARVALALPILLILVSSVDCARQRFETSAHFDTTYDFATVHTFAFAPQREKVAKSESGRILEQAIREQLVARGYEESTRDSADVLVSYDVGVYARAKLSGAVTFPVSQGGLTVQVFDRESGRSIWYGWSEANLRPDDDREEVIRSATAALFEDQIPIAN